MAPIVRAIDVGFGNTKYVRASQDGRVECSHFASIAYDSAHDSSGDGIGNSRRTVCVPVGGIWYEVGPDVALAADASDALAIALCHAHARRVAAFTQGPAALGSARRAGTSRT